MRGYDDADDVSDIEPEGRWCNVHGTEDDTFTAPYPTYVKEPGCTCTMLPAVKPKVIERTDMDLTEIAEAIVEAGTEDVHQNLRRAVRTSRAKEPHVPNTWPKTEAALREFAAKVWMEGYTFWYDNDRPPEHKDYGKGNPYESPKRVLITEPYDGHPDTETCPGCPHPYKPATPISEATP